MTAKKSFFVTLNSAKCTLNSARCTLNSAKKKLKKIFKNAETYYLSGFQDFKKNS